MIPTRRGKHLLMYKDFTFSQQNRSRNFYCSKKDEGCKAKIKLDDNGQILPVSNTVHIHPPPLYIMSSQGNYIKICEKKRKIYPMLPTEHRNQTDSSSHSALGAVFGMSRIA